MRNRRILAPGESINVITVGALHSDRSEPPAYDHRIDILPNRDLPSPITAHGNGFRNAVKPEIFMPGGRQLFDYNRESGTFMINAASTAPGQKAAAAPSSSNELKRVCYTRGTSNATAIASRRAAQIHEVLDELRYNAGYAIPEQNMAVLIKALLIHSTSWGEVWDLAGKFLPNNNKTLLKKQFARYLGYGTPVIERVLECTGRRATAFGCGKIRKEERHEYRFPLPPSLGGSTILRRLIITLAWFSPINPNHGKIRKAKLEFLLPKEIKSIIPVNRKEVDWLQVQKGTVQHEILEDDKLTTYRDGKFLLIPVECREEAGGLDEDIYYSLVVTLEVAEDSIFTIYEEIKNRIRIGIQT